MGRVRMRMRSGSEIRGEASEADGEVRTMG